MKPKSRMALENAWARLLAAQPSAMKRMRVYELDRETPWGSISLGVDADDVRHLLVPILSSMRIRAGLDGPGLMLRKRVLEDDDTRTMFADLSCRRPELHHLFDDLCSDIVVELEDHEKQPLRAVYQVVDRWRSLFASPTGVLPDEAAAGLYGELLVLRRLLGEDASAHRSWVGPQGAHHDFVFNGFDVEVKATEGVEGRAIRVHGLDQLEPPEAGDLFLAWFRLTDSRLSGTGASLLDLAEEVLALADDEPAIRTRLAQVGYVPGAVDTNDTRRWTVVDERWYAVDEEFPRIVRSTLDTASVPATVSDVHYTIDLTADSPAPIPAETVDQMLRIGADTER